MEDARATMDLYKLVRDEWENSIIQGHSIQDEIVVTEKTVKNRNKREQKKLKRALKKQKSVASLTKFENNVQTNDFHRSKSDSNLLSRQHNYSYYGNMNYGNNWTGHQGYHSWNGNRTRHQDFNSRRGNQQLLQDEFWQDDVMNNGALF